MKVDFYKEELMEGEQLVIVFETSKGKYKQFPIGLLEDINLSQEDCEKLESIYIDTNDIKN